MAGEPQVTIFFESKALEPDTFKVVRFEGEEEISRPYRFVVDLVSDRPDVDLDATLGRPATLSFRRGEDGPLRKIHGVPAEIELSREGEHGHYFYRAVLVPRLWMLGLTRQNQIYQNKTVPEIIEEELKGSKSKGPAGNATFELAADDFEFRLSGSYPQKEYLVQYRESDLDFISRLLEHVGICYYFEQGEERERIVFCDANVHLPHLPDEDRFPYVPPSGTSSSLAESVQFLSSRRRQITDRVLLKDYNYRTPSTPLQAEQDVEGDGYGIVCHYGDHFKTPEEGQALAKVRAEEILSRKAAYHGAGDCQGFTAGHIFALEDHFNEGLNQDYVLTALRHFGSQASSEAAGFDQGAEARATSYRNEFEAIPKTVAYRPPRRTAKPKLHGVMNATIDAGGAGTRAEIDGEGRYKLVMPFDLSGTAEGKATRWVRMAQPYGGGQHGMHFPLLKGTEVLWTCIDGDPDRPIITGVVPNPLNKSVVNADSHTRNRIKTASGILMEFQDGPGPAAQATSAAGDALGGQQQGQRIDGIEPEDAERSAADRESASLAISLDEDPAVSHENSSAANQDLQEQQHHAYTGTGGAEDPGHIEQEQKWFRVDVPNYDGNNNRSYSRLGKYSGVAPESDVYYKDPAGGEEQKGIGLGLNSDKENGALDGAFDYAEGNRTEITTNNREVVIGNRSMITIGSDSLGVWDAQTAYKNHMRRIGGIGEHGIWRHTVHEHTSEDTFQWGDKESHFAGFNLDSTSGLDIDLAIGGELNGFLGANVDMGLGYDVNALWGEDIDVVRGTNTELATKQELVGQEGVMLRVPGSVENAGYGGWSTALGAVFGLIAGGAFGVLASGLPGAYDEDQSGGPGEAWGTTIGFALATATYAAGIAYAAHYKKTRLKNEATSPTVFKMDKRQVEITVEEMPTRVRNSAFNMKCDHVRLSVGANTFLTLSDGEIVLQAGATKLAVSASKGIALSGPKEIKLSSLEGVQVSSPSAIEFSSMAYTFR